MPATQTKTAASDKIRHEEFCLPRPDADEPRIEIYDYLADDPASGRSKPSHTVTRCMECGAAHYAPKEK